MADAAASNDLAEIIALLKSIDSHVKRIAAEIGER